MSALAIEIETRRRQEKRERRKRLNGMLNRIVDGDAFDVLPRLPPCSVQICIISPSYWQLRDHGTAQWLDGDPACSHRWRSRYDPNRFSTLFGGDSRNAGCALQPVGTVCPYCGAVRVDRQIGIEATPEEYVARLVRIGREVRRVLRPDGTFWLVLGDTYASDWPSSRRNIIGNASLPNGKREARPSRLGGAKNKDRLMIPARIALGLRDDGWYLRDEIILYKTNAMPESVTDRCTRAHENLYLLSKNRHYYFDHEAIKEPIAESTRADPRLTKSGYRVGRPDRGYRGSPAQGGGAFQPNDRFKRNRRSVWVIVNQPSQLPHFATFSESLVEAILAAGSRPGDIVLDCFSGTGTVATVAERMGRRWIGIELKPQYARWARQRVRDAIR